MRTLATALALTLLGALALTGCSNPVNTEPGKTDKPEAQQLRKDKTGD